MTKSFPSVSHITDWHGILLLDSRYPALQDASVFEDLMKFLTFEEQSQVLKRKSYSDKCKTLCNRLLKSTGISMVTGVSINQIDFCNEVYGKPRIKNQGEIAFNMSNGRFHVAQYISKRKSSSVCQEVGIDLASAMDYCDDDDDLDNFKQIFSPKEFESLIQYNQLRERACMFAYLWSLKESYTKFTGLGLNSDLRRIDFGKLDLFEHEVILRRRIDNKEMWFYSSWITPDEVVTVCHELDYTLDGIPHIYHLTLQDVLEKLQEID